MSLDFTTLFLFTLDVEAMLGLLLLFSWAQNTGVTAVAWWGAANLLRALSIGLYGMYGALPDFLTIKSDAGQSRAIFSGRHLKSRDSNPHSSATPMITRSKSRA